MPRSDSYHPLLLVTKISTCSHSSLLGYAASKGVIVTYGGYLHQCQMI